MRLFLAMLCLISCSSSKHETAPCAEELRTVIVPALQRSLDGGDADTFHRSTATMMQATMCGPDVATLLREWEVALREAEPTKAAERRHQLLARLTAVLSGPEWQEEARVLASLSRKSK